MDYILKYLAIYILSMLGSLSLYTKYLPQYDPLHPIDYEIVPMLTNLKFSIIHSSFLVTIVGSLIFYIYLKTKHIILPKRRLFIFLSSVLTPALTTYAQNAKESGRQLAMLLIQRIENPALDVQIVRVKGSIREGETVLTI